MHGSSFLICFSITCKRILMLLLIIPCSLIRSVIERLIKRTFVFFAIIFTKLVFLHAEGPHKSMPLFCLFLLTDCVYYFLSSFFLFLVPNNRIKRIFVFCYCFDFFLEVSFCKKSLDIRFYECLSIGNCKFF